MTAKEQGLPDMGSVRGMVEDLKDCGRLCEAYSPDTIATAIPGIGWIAMRHKLNKAAEMLAALASDTGERGVVEPYSEEDSRRQQTSAWAAVCAALDEVSPEWHGLTMRGKDSAVAAIRALRAQPAGGGEWPCPGCVEPSPPHEPDCRLAPPESGGQGEWAEAVRVACLDDVDEALREFATDPTGDNGTTVVREIIRAAIARRAAITQGGGNGR